MEVLKTKRLLLRPFQLGDLDDFYEYAKNPNVGPNAGWKPHESKEDSLKILNEFIEKDEVWAIVEAKRNKVIGSIGLHNDSKRDFDKVKMLGYVLDESYWGKGIGTEAAKAVINYAFGRLDVEILSVFHYSFNNRSKRVIEKCGFQFEGTLRMGSKLFNGVICDEVCYSITKADYVSTYHLN